MNFKKKIKSKKLVISIKSQAAQPFQKSGERMRSRHKAYCYGRILPASQKSQAAMEKPLRKPWESTLAGHKVQRTNYILPASTKSQAAMEFLMTYGWALLVILLVVGALAYFGVLSPSRFLPERANLGPEFPVLTLQGHAV